MNTWGSIILIRTNHFIHVNVILWMQMFYFLRESTGFKATEASYPAMIIQLKAVTFFS